MALGVPTEGPPSGNKGMDEIREVHVGEVGMVKKGEMLLCKEGNTKEEMTESLMGIREGRWPVGRVERTLVCREADTRMAANGRAAHVLEELEDELKQM